MGDGVTWSLLLMSSLLRKFVLVAVFGEKLTFLFLITVARDLYERLAPDF